MNGLRGDYASSGPDIPVIRPVVRRRRQVAGLSLLFAVLSGTTVVISSCGGSDSDGIEDARRTATAASQTRPSPTATPDVASAYRQGVNEQVPALLSSLSQLNDDLLGAQANQADPKWPGILEADLADVQTRSANIVALVPAPAQTEFHSMLSANLKQIIQGCEQLSTSISTAEPEGAAEAVSLIFDGRDDVQVTLQALPPE
jgi:hypothetical protein